MKGTIRRPADWIFKQKAKEMVKNFNFLYEDINLDKNDIKKVLSELNSFGYGKFELKEYRSDFEVKISLEDSFNNIIFEKSDRPVCKFIEGFLESLFEYISSRGCECKEEKCEAMGDDKCLFKIQINEQEIKKEWTKNSGVKGEEMELELKNNRIIHRGAPSMIMSRDVSSQIEKRIRELIGEGARAIIYRTNNESTNEVIKSKKMSSFLLKLFKNVMKGYVSDYVSRELTDRGYGRVKFKFEGNRAVATVKNCHNCLNQKSEEPICYNLQGIFAAIGEFLMGKEVICEETKCIAKGDDVCKFIVTEKKVNLLSSSTQDTHLYVYL